jgi:hypothetical protein
VKVDDDTLTSLLHATLDDDRNETVTQIRPVTLRRMIHEIRSLRSDLARVTAERDEMADAVLRERNEKWQDVMRHGGYVKERVEHDTAEAIAAWLSVEACHMEVACKHAPTDREADACRSSAATHRSLAADIRSHAWRTR